MSDMAEVCSDNRFELICAAKAALLEDTNIEDNQTDMAALDSILFRCWQMGWLGRETCKYDETEIIPVIRIVTNDTFDNDPLGVRIHVLECTVCGGTYEHVNGDYEFCPRCGRKCEGGDV